MSEHTVPPVNINERNTRIIPVEFEYFEPRTLSEALELLDKWGEDAKILAGGTDLVVKMKTRLVQPKIIVNIKKVPGLRYIKEDQDSIRIGALTTLRDIERSEVVKKFIPALHDAVRSMGSIQVRNMATIGGNLCNASPAADTAPPLLVYDSVVKAVSTRGERYIPLEEFFRGPGATSIRPNEILTEVVIKKSPRGASAFKKISRVAVDLAIASAAVYLEARDNIIERARISLGSVAPTPIRARKTEVAIWGLKIGSSELQRALAALECEISPITDVRSTADYRRHIVKVLTWDALNEAYSRLQRVGGSQ